VAEHPNVTALRNVYEAFGKGDLDTVRQQWTDDVTFHVKGLGSLDGDYQGPDAVIGFFGKLMDATSGTFRLDIHTILADDEHAAILATEHAERNGQTLSADVVHVTHLRDGKTQEFWSATTDPEGELAFWR
jgi:ketosteroid isomerase-like protein